MANVQHLLALLTARSWAILSKKFNLYRAGYGQRSAPTGSSDYYALKQTITKICLHFDVILYESGLHFHKLEGFF